MATSLNFLVSISGIYICFLSWGVLQESLTTKVYGGASFSHFTLLNFIQSIFAGIIGLLYTKAYKLPLLFYKDFFLVALSSSLASPVGYISLKYINYPTFLLAKSCKLLPLMFVSRVFFGRKFALYQYLSVVMISVGVSLFMTFKKQKENEEGSNSWFGIFLVLLNLFLDGFTNSKQDNLFVVHKNLTSKQLMFGMNVSSAVWMILYLIYEQKELNEGLGLLLAHPAILSDVLLFCIAGAVGQIFIFHTLENFGSRTLVTVNVTRKVFSILLSVFWFNHGISGYQWMAVAFVFAGILLESGMKSMAVKVRIEEPVSMEQKKKKRD